MMIIPFVFLGLALSAGMGCGNSAAPNPSTVQHFSSSTVQPYGVCAHLPRHDADFRDRECAAIAALGASTVRFGVSWRGMQKSPDAPLDFSKLDAIVAEAEAHGPCEYVFRGSLPRQAKRDGLWDPATVPGRHSMATFLLYYCDYTMPVRHQPVNIVVRNCAVENAARPAAAHYRVRVLRGFV